MSKKLRKGLHHGSVWRFNKENEARISNFSRNEAKGDKTKYTGGAVLSTNFGNFIFDVVLSILRLE